MQASKIALETNKYCIKLYNKYYKIWYKGAHKAIKQGVKKGRSVITYIVDSIDIDYNLRLSINKAVIEQLEKEGFYIRKYDLGFSIGFGHFIISWGNAIQHQKDLDKRHEELYEQNVGGHDENN